MKIFATHKYPSAIIRGMQVAEKLNCGFNVGYEEIEDNETIIFVKGFCFDPIKLIREKQCNVFIDLIDSDVLLPDLYNHPAIGVIAISSLAHAYLRARLPFTRKIVTIDEYHCNFENIKREERKVETVGYVGSKYRFDLPLYELRSELAKVGLKFKHLFCEDLSLKREDICRFYESIDIQLCFCIPKLIPNMPPEMKNPLKIANAASFGIPTVGFPEICWGTEDGCWIPSMDLSSSIVSCKMLVEEKDVYTTIAIKCIAEAQKYHIDNIIKQYKELEKCEM